MDVLKALEPYKPGDEGGNSLLWMLHVLDTTDKHHLLLPMFATFAGGMLLLVVPGPEGAEPVAYYGTALPPMTSPIEDNTMLFTFVTPVQMHVGVQIALQIAFAEPEIVKGQPIVSTLHQLAGVVDGVAEAFGRAGLLPGWTAGPTHTEPTPPESHP